MLTIAHRSDRNRSWRRAIDGRCPAPTTLSPLSPGDPVPRVLQAAAVLVACAGVIPPAWGAEASGAPERVVVLASSPSGAALAERIRGQVSDLPFEVSVLRVDAEAGEDARRHAAERLILEHGAEAVVWYEHAKVSVLRAQGAGVSITQRSFAERPRPPGEQPSRDLASADLEAAAVVVRFALLQPAGGAASAGPAPAAVQVAPAAPASAPVPAVERLAVATSAQLGWQSLRDGLSALDQSLLAEATLSLSRFEVGAFGTVGAERAVAASGGASADLERQSVGLLAGVLFVDTARWRIGGRVLMGATSFRLTSQVPGEAPQTDDRVRLFGGLEARVEAVVKLARLPVQLSAGAGVLAVDAAPALYSGATAAVRLAAVEPRLVLAAGVLFR
jgi:hypothetical protein